MLLSINTYKQLLYNKLGHTLFEGPILAINIPLTMTFSSVNF